MKIETRIKKIEDEILGQGRIPKSEGFVVFYPSETEEEKELKLEKRLKELREKYGGDVSRADLLSIQVVYDQKPHAEQG